MTDLEPYDQGAFERFCSALVADGFDPTPGTNLRKWTGPLRPSLRSLVTVETMQVEFYDGWPLRYAHVRVEGLSAPHAGGELVCLWAEDDPAQIKGRTLGELWARLDDWAAKAASGFGRDDEALDSYRLFRSQSQLGIEIPLADLLKNASDGHLVELTGDMRGVAIRVMESQKQGPFRGALYFRKHGAAPRDLPSFRNALTRRQRRHLEEGLEKREPTLAGMPSRGLDFAVLAWPVFANEVDAVPLLFRGTKDSIAAEALNPTPSDVTARRKRAGQDSEPLGSKRVLVVGTGSIGGQAALAVAQSGVGYLCLADGDILKSANLIRHVAWSEAVGYRKTTGVKIAIADHSPWCEVEERGSVPLGPSALRKEIQGFDLVLDCTGDFSVSAALSQITRDEGTPLITVALYHQGAILRIRRQTSADLSIAELQSSGSAIVLPPESPRPAGSFLEIGCTAVVNSAPPWAAMRAGADAAATVVDTLLGRLQFDSEQVVVLRRLAIPFDQLGQVQRSEQA